jgi:lipoprotein-anchoring transpeptidase ErfK/SrfK
MSPGYPILAAALAGVLGIAVIGQIRGDDSDTTAIAPAASPATSVPISSPATTVAPVDPPAAPTTAASTTSAASTTVPVPTPEVALPAGLPADGNCPEAGRAAVVDRDHQLTWLCADGAPTAMMPITSAWSMPDPGDYSVYAKDLNASSTFGGYFSTMTHFVAFAYGENTGARVAFHSVPRYPGGGFVQPLESVGDRGRRGESSGCIRVLPDDAVRIWEWLAIGDAVRVIS